MVQTPNNGMEVAGWIVDLFLAYWLFGMGVALAVFFSLKAKRRAWIPHLVWWVWLIVGAVTCMYGLFQSTAPSFATRIIAVGRSYDYVEHRQGRNASYYSFRLVPDSGQPVNIETRIIIPGWGDPAIFNGRTFRVVYLEDNNRALKNEAIEIEILSGEHAGYRDFLDARPLGKWLAILLGAALGTFGYFGLRYRKDDAMLAASQNNTPTSLPRSFHEKAGASQDGFIFS
jgi:hypothetical protein